MLIAGPAFAAAAIPLRPMPDPSLITIGSRSVPARVLGKLRELDEQETRFSTELEDPANLADHKKVRDLTLQRAAVLPVVDGYRRLRALLNEIEGLEAVIAAKEDRELVALAEEELPNVRDSAQRTLDEVLARLVTADDRKVGSVMMELRAGTGGDEACIWCRDLLDMYTRYAAKRGWTVETLDLSEEPAVGGIRSAVLNVRGDGVWSELAFEAGVHSVKRVPATEAQGRIHTSTATVAALPEPEEVDIKIDWANDVEETITTSQGPGGQNVNKVATAVQLHHKPSGILIRMQESKSQQQNRTQAKRLLMTKLHDIEQRRLHAQRSAARRGQIGTGDRSEKIRTYRWKEGIVADERLPGEYQLRDIMSGDLSALMADLLERETVRRLAEL
jgi:peptide chain release factor 1